MTDTQIKVPEIVVCVPAHTVSGIIAAAPAVSVATAATTPEEDREKDAAGDRNDFIKRLFAVAISVGFANHIDQLRWMATLSPPDQKTAQNSALLLVAVLTTVLSWEGYLTSLRDRPLLDRYYNCFRISDSLNFIPIAKEFCAMDVRDIRHLRDVGLCP